MKVVAATALVLAGLLVGIGLILSAYASWTDRQWQYHQQAASDIARQQAMERLQLAYLSVLSRMRAEARRRS